MRCTAAVGSSGNRSRQPAVESSPVPGPNAAMPSTIWKKSQSKFFFCPLPVGAGKSGRKKASCARPLYTSRADARKTKTLANFVEMVCCRAVGCVAFAERRLAELLQSESVGRPYFLPLIFRHLKPQNASSWEGGKRKQNRPRNCGITNRENAETKIQESREAGLIYWPSRLSGTGSRHLSPTPTLSGVVGTAAVNLSGE